MFGGVIAYTGIRNDFFQAQVGPEKEEKGEIP
jgi:hypothetical protein